MFDDFYKIAFIVCAVAYFLVFIIFNITDKGDSHKRNTKRRLIQDLQMSFNKPSRYSSKSNSLNKFEKKFATRITNLLTISATVAYLVDTFLNLESASNLETYFILIWMVFLILGTIIIYLLYSKEVKKEKIKN